VFCENRDALVEYLKVNEIGSRKIYSPLYSQKVYNLDLKHPVTERYSNRGIWLPSSLDLTEQQIMHICYIIKKFFKENKGVI
jgi:dTDP-4-amino-4,6-dideoxygalactose transaminase